MQVLLINQNATIERLVSLSTGKLLYTLDKVGSSAEAEAKDYDFIIIDSDLYEHESFSAVKNGSIGATTIMMLSKGFERPSGIDIFIEKPFLPTELVDILSTARSVEDVNMNTELANSTSMDDPTSGFGSEIPSLDDMELGDMKAPEESTDIGGLDDLDLDSSSNEIDLDSLDADEIRLDDMHSGEGEDEIRLDDIGLSEVSLDDEPSFPQVQDELENDDLANLDLGDISNDDEEDIKIEDVPVEDIKLEEDSGELNLDDISFDDVPTAASDDELVVEEEIDNDSANELSLDDLKEEESADDIGASDIDLDQLDLEDEPGALELEDESLNIPDSFESDINLDELSLDDDPVAPSIEEELSLDDELPSLDDSELGEKIERKDETLADFDALDDELLENLSIEEEHITEETPLDDVISEIEHLEEGMEEEDQEESPKVPSSIFGDDEVQKLKDLLGDNNEPEVEVDDEEMSVQNDEFASLTEESVASALGIDYENETHDDFTDIGLENLDDVALSPAMPSVASVASSGVQSVQLSGSDLLSLPVDRIKELLEVADITVNITLSKKS